MAGYAGGSSGRLPELFAALQSVAVLAEPGGRGLLLRIAERELERPVGVGTGEGADAGYFHLELAMACLNSPRTMTAVCNALALLDEEGTAAVRALGAELTAQPVLPPEQEERLRDLLKDLTTPRLDQLCRDAAGDLHDPYDLPAFDDAWSAHQALSGLNAREDGLPPALALVEYLAAEVAYDFDRAIALRGWNDRQAAALGLASELGVLRQRVQYAPPSAAHDAYLVIRLLPAEEPGRYRLTSWRHYGSGEPGSWQPRQGRTAVFTLAEAEAEVQELVYEAEEEWARDAGCIHVEFALLTEELNLPVQLWRFELDSDTPALLCTAYPVVVRSLTRGRTPRWHRLWRRRWQLLREHPEQWQHLMVGHPDGHHPPAGRADILEARLRADESVGTVVLSGPPEARTDGGAELQAALRTGVPVMLWLGRDEPARGTAGEQPHDLPGTEESDGTAAPFERLLRDPVELREAVKQLRLEAQSASPDRPDHRVGRRVVLLWDDPTRPVETHEPLSGPDRWDRRRVDGR
jgi:hypothetical protein